jgi:hypothetical protein
MSFDFTEKVWGYELPRHNEDFCAKEMGLDQGSECSVHVHVIKKEIFIVTKGVIRLEIWDPLTTFDPGKITEKGLLCPKFHKIDLSRPTHVRILDSECIDHAYYIHHYVPHRFIGLGALNEFVEASTYDDPNDSYRFTTSRKPDNRK